jgi:hypothetical protein
MRSASVVRPLTQRPAKRVPTTTIRLLDHIAGEGQTAALTIVLTCERKNRGDATGASPFVRR